MGYYICRDCGFLYEVRPCTLPTATDRCPNGHIKVEQIIIAINKILEYF